MAVMPSFFTDALYQDLLGTLRFRGSLLRTPSSSVQTPVRTSGRSDPPDVRTLRSPGHPDAPILRTSGRSSIVTSPGHLSLGIPLSGRSSGLPDIPSVGPFNFRLPDLDPHLRFRTRFPDPSNEPRTSRSSSQHSPSSLLFPLLHSPDLATVTPSDPFLSSAPDVRPGPPDLRNLHTSGLSDVAYCRTGSCQILWPSHSTSALTPLSLPYPIVRFPSSDFRAPDSVPVFRTSDPRLRTSGTSGRPPVVPSSFIGSTYFPRAFLRLLRPSSSGFLAPDPDPCPSLFSDPDCCSVLRDFRNLRTVPGLVLSVPRVDRPPPWVILSLFSKDPPSAQIVILRILLLPRPLFIEPSQLLPLQVFLLQLQSDSLYSTEFGCILDEIQVRAYQTADPTVKIKVLYFPASQFLCATKGGLRQRIQYICAMICVSGRRGRAVGRGEDPSDLASSAKDNEPELSTLSIGNVVAI
ncbi:hypothetical protein K438DRAFT_1791677 [Mycena galopus ATCC 62051]|nr:hypothetical protein K438DRAFT_1791677 [Mycena galopus ATCC 62051]